MNLKQKIILIFILAIAVSMRFTSLGTNPPDLYWDEVAIGYDAFSVLKTGNDQHGVPLPLFFESFGDWKLPGYIYTLVPFIAIFGLNEIAVRIPSALLGSLTVLVLFFIIKSQTKNIQLSLCSALLLAISPWHIQFSRAAFESSCALFIFLVGFYLWLKSQTNNRWYVLYLSVFLLGLSQYFYHSYRIFTPLMLAGLAIIYRNTLFKHKKQSLIALLLFLVLSAPLVGFSLSKEGLSRATSETAFNQKDREEQRLLFDQRSKPPFRFLSKYLYQEHLYNSQIVVKNYLSHFSPDFLFLKGDQVGRHSQVDLGQIHIFELPLIALGLFLIGSIKNRQLLKAMLLWLVFAPVAATIVSPNPHANRSLQMIIPLTFIGALGLNYLLVKLPKVVLAVCAFWMLGVLATFGHLVFEHYPKKFASDWQSGNREMVLTVDKIANNYPKIYVTNTVGVPYIYFLFYSKFDPKTYQKSGSPSAFGKYEFVPPSSKTYEKKNALYVAPAWQELEDQIIGAIKDNNGKTVYRIWELGR